jgi:hypothetical protein
VCDGTRAKLTCVAGYLLDEEVCNAYEACEETPVLTHCANQPDPRCPPTGNAFFCDGNTLITCGSGLSGETDCGDQTCVEDPNGEYARCQ